MSASRIICRKNIYDTVLETNSLSHDDMKKHYQNVMLNDLFFGFRQLSEEDHMKGFGSKERVSVH